MTQWLAHSEFVNNISRELLKPRLEHYSEDSISYQLRQLPHLHLRHLKIHNSFHEQLYAVLVDQRQRPSDTCIIYMHGMGSNILEGCGLINLLPKNVALCCFDFSASGKSQGTCSAYGIKEYQDIGFIIKLLKKQGYKRFVLWGRSMGAFASLAYSSTEAVPGQIVLQVVDSAFSSFENVCRQRAKFQMRMPQFLVNYGVNLMKHNLQHHLFNPFNFNLSDILNRCRVSTIFVYNQHDEVVPIEDTQELIRQISINCKYERLIINDSHNCCRSEITLSKIIALITKYISQPESRSRTHKRKALDVCSSYIKSSSSKNLTIETEVQSGRTKRKTALFCSLSKQAADSPKKGSRCS